MTTTLTLSNTATITGAGLIATGTGQGWVGSADYFGQGKYYFESKMNVVTSGGTGAGIGNRSSNSAVSGVPNAVIYLAGNASGQIFSNGAYTGYSLGVSVTNDVTCVAVDLINRLVWFRKNAGLWNGNGTANPTTGINGIDLSWSYFIPTNYAFAPQGYVYASGEQQTFNFGGSAFAQTVPSGFTSGWPSVSGPAANRVSASYNEVITIPQANDRVSTMYNEIITGPAVAAVDRVSTLYNEVITGPQAGANDRISTLYLEVIGAPILVVRRPRSYAAILG